MAIAVPLIAAGIGAAGSAYSAHKAASAQAPLTALAQQQGARGQQLFNFGFPQLQKTAGYYGALLGGNRQAVTQALAPTVEHIGETYKGAERNLTRMAPGAGRDEAAADLNRQKAAQIGGLPIAARSEAATALTGMGQSATGSGISATQSAGGLYDSALVSQRYNDQQQYQLGSNLSKVIGDFITAYRERNAGKTSGPGFPYYYPSDGNYYPGG
ncbi:MAG TPA: hypothetical protein VN903_31195 [Polyangia bacterium]|nr:hypothetical protein [Polyangia bacterium]